jgi:hypothetical protein
MGWLNEISALQIIRKRMGVVAGKTGWDVFTFHTQHNLDHFYDSNISALGHTWVNEGSLSAAAVKESKSRFGHDYDYHQLQPRLAENLVFQASLMDWVAQHADNVPLQFHVVGTALYSALIRTGALSFESALDSVLKVGARWDRSILRLAEKRAAQTECGKTETEIGWQRFELVQAVMDGRERLSLPVIAKDLPKVDAPSHPFWFSPAGDEDPIRIKTSRDAVLALESLNISSWYKEEIRPVEGAVQGMLAGALHPLARSCRWSLGKYLLATPACILMFLRHIASITPAPAVISEAERQNRLRLSRIKVTGP